MHDINDYIILDNNKTLSVVISPIPTVPLAQCIAKLIGNDLAIYSVSEKPFQTILVTMHCLHENTCERLKSLHHITIAEVNQYRHFERIIQLPLTSINTGEPTA